ncbi:MAG: hypothetical protein KGM99_10575, partial [Burkholderiales bacterium]|nr:hypothetical protein [Burkholderiales bacterium]
MKTAAKLTAPVWASYGFALITLLLVLKAGLLVALFSGLLMYSLIHLMAPMIARKFSHRQPRMIAVALLATLLIVAVIALIWAIQVFLRSDAGNFQTLLQKLADIIEQSRSQLPVWVSSNLPEDVGALQEMIAHWLREHANEAKLLVPEAGHLLVHLLLGMIIGSMIALRDASGDENHKPFAAALQQRVANLGQVFQKIVFAQVRISLINTVLSG